MEIKKAVIYTDGGCRPSRGIGGWGFFGYVYTDEVPKQGSGAKGHYPTAKGYIPTAYKRSGGVEIPEVTPVSYVEGHGSLIPESTNNEAEVMALFEALKYVESENLTHVYFRIDSKYTLGGIQDWMPKWRSIKFIKPDGTEVANRDLWVKTDDLYQHLKTLGVEIGFEWVKGHSDELGNDSADELATKAIVVGRNGIRFGDVTEHPAKGYWNIDNSIHPFFAHNRIVFWDHQPTTIADGKYRYTTAELGKSVEDSLIGKRMTDASFAVLDISAPIDVLERIQHHYQSTLSNVVGRVVVGRMDTILKPVNYRDIIAKGGLYTHRFAPRNDLFDYRDNLMIAEINPTGLSFRAMEEFDALSAILGFYKQHKAGQTPLKFRVSDITNTFFEVVEADKKKPKYRLRKEIDSTLKHVDVGAVYNNAEGVDVTDQLRLLIGTDTLKRNALANLADPSTRVFVVTWPESTQAYRYATIVEHVDDVGVWAAVYANIKLITP